MPIPDAEARFITNGAPPLIGDGLGTVTGKFGSGAVL